MDFKAFGSTNIYLPSPHMHYILTSLMTERKHVSLKNVDLFSWSAVSSVTKGVPELRSLSESTDLNEKSVTHCGEKKLK